MKHILPILTYLLLVSGGASAQCIIASLETGLPLRDVKVYADNGRSVTTNYLGEVGNLGNYRSATIAHPSFLSRTVTREEMCDTIFLLPKAINLGEVVVWGKYRPRIQSMVSSTTQDLEAYAPSKGLVSFDFMQMFKKKPLNKKARKKNQELLENWDQLYTDSVIGRKE